MSREFREETRRLKKSVAGNFLIGYNNPMEAENKEKISQSKPVNVLRSVKIPDLLIVFFIAVTVYLFISAYTFKWPLIIQAVAVVKFIKRLLVMIYAALPVIVLGHWISGRLFRFYPLQSKTWSFVIAWACGWASVIAIALVLLAVGVYTVVAWKLFALTFNLGFLLWLFRRRWEPLKNLWRNVLPELKEDILGKFSGTAAIWNIFILLVFVMAFLLALIPPNSRDELTYHLVLPQLWNFQQNWWVSSDNYCLVFPANIEIIWGYAMAVGGYLLPRLFTLLFGIISVGAFRAWLKPKYTDPWVRELSVLFFLAAPIMVLTLPICYVEWPMLLFLFLGWWASRRFLETDDNGYILLTAAAWGISVGTKYSVIPVVGLLGLEWLFQILRRVSLKTAVKAGVVLFIGVLIFLGPWLVRNYALTKDPVFPLGQSLVSTEASSGPEADSLNVSHLTGYSDIGGLWHLNPWVYHTTVDNISDHRLHPGWLLLHAAVILLGWRFLNRKPWITVVVLTVVLFYFAPAARIYFPLMLLTWLFLPRFLEYFNSNKRHRWIISALMVVYLVPSLSISFYDGFMTYGRTSQDYLIGMVNEEMLLRRDGVMTPVMEWIQQKTPWRTRLWVWGDDRVFYFDRWTRPDSPFDLPAYINILKSQGPQGLTESVKKDKIDYIVLNIKNCSFSSKTIKTEKMSWAIPDPLRDQLLSWVKQNLKPIIKDKKYELYKVL
jgi:hypothetical protein